MAYLLKVLSDMLQRPQPLSHIHICPKPKSQTRTHRFFSIRRHRVILTKPLLETLIKSVSPRWDCKLSTAYCNNSGLTKICNRSHRDCNANSLSPLRNVSVQPRWAKRSHRVCLTNSLFVYYQNRSHRVCLIGLTEITLCPNPNKIGPTEVTWRSHRES